MQQRRRLGPFPLPLPVLSLVAAIMYLSLYLHLRSVYVQGVDHDGYLPLSDDSMEDLPDPSPTQMRITCVSNVTVPDVLDNLMVIRDRKVYAQELCARRGDGGSMQGSAAAFCSPYTIPGLLHLDFNLVEASLQLRSQRIQHWCILRCKCTIGNPPGIIRYLVDHAPNPKIQPDLIFQMQPDKDFHFNYQTRAALGPRMFSERQQLRKDFNGLGTTNRIASLNSPLISYYGKTAVPFTVGGQAVYDPWVQRRIALNDRNRIVCGEPGFLQISDFPLLSTSLTEQELCASSLDGGDLNFNAGTYCNWRNTGVFGTPFVDFSAELTASSALLLPENSYMLEYIRNFCRGSCKCHFLESMRESEQETRRKIAVKLHSAKAGALIEYPKAKPQPNAGQGAQHDNTRAGSSGSAGVDSLSRNEPTQCSTDCRSNAACTMPGSSSDPTIDPVSCRCMALNVGPRRYTTPGCYVLASFIASSVLSTKQKAGLGWGNGYRLNPRREDRGDEGREEIDPDLVEANVNMNGFACVCNSTYISMACCHSTTGLIWEDKEIGYLGQLEYESS